MEELKAYQEAVKNLRESLGIKHKAIPIEDFSDFFFQEINVDELGKGELRWAYKQEGIKSGHYYILYFLKKLDSKDLVVFYSIQTKSFVLFKKENEIK